MNVQVEGISISPVVAGDSNVNVLEHVASNQENVCLEVPFVPSHENRIVALVGVLIVDELCLAPIVEDDVANRISCLMIHDQK